jgi:hypothetical protein
LQSGKLLNLASATEAARQIDAVNELLSKANASQPAGASVRLAMATGRSVSVIEIFRRPLVIAYRAIDYPIGAGGKCAAPVPTLSVLEGRAIKTGQPIEYTGCDENCQRIRTWIKQQPAAAGSLAGAERRQHCHRRLPDRRLRPPARKDGHRTDRGTVKGETQWHYNRRRLRRTCRETMWGTWWMRCCWTAG